MGDGGAATGAIIFAGSTYLIAIDKACHIKKTNPDKGGTMLDYVDTPFADTSTRMGPLTTALMQKYGNKWIQSLMINDL